MTITRISKAKNFGIFRDFTWPSNLPDFGKFNLIYGWNGTGKSTLSNLFRALETQTNIDGAQVTIAVDNNPIEGSNFKTAQVPIRVFNRSFIDENVFTMDGEMTPIFVLGKESVEKQKRLERLRPSLEQGKKDLQGLQTKQSDELRAFEDFCSSQAKAIKDQLTATGSNYRNYDRRNFQATVERLMPDNNIQRYMIAETERERLTKQHLATEKLRIDAVSYAFPDLIALQGDIGRLLERTIVSSVIQSLRDDPDLSTWTRDGLKKHKERESEVCLFCNQQLPEGRISALEAHFSDEYERFLNEITAMQGLIQELDQAAGSVRTPIKAQFYDHLAEEYGASLEHFSNEVQQLRKTLGRFEEALNGKKDALFQKCDINLPASAPRKETLEKLNAVIAEHNKATAEFAACVQEARRGLEEAAVADSIEKYVRLKAQHLLTDEFLKTKKEETRTIEIQIAELEREVIEHRKPAEELNQDLSAYLGHGEISLGFQGTGYQIMRNGAGAQKLSEGEKTAVALLYFLKSLQDRRFNLKSGIVVIDDPVSSLDSNALFSAFGFIKGRTSDAGQLFVTTHNFALFRQVRNWFHHLPGQRKDNIMSRPARFYMLDCTRNGGERCTNIKNLDPLLEKYESEYHYLFHLVYEAAHNPSSEGLESNYSMPNVARRLLESFLAFREPGKAGDLRSQLQGNKFAEAKKTRILRFLHTHSHGDEIGEPEHDPSILSETKAVMQDLLDFIEHLDPGHFSAMESLLKNNEIEAV